LIICEIVNKRYSFYVVAQNNEIDTRLDNVATSNSSIEYRRDEDRLVVSPALLRTESDYP
ncbi:hypothetical protein O5472_26245, partial [Escherichia coli]|nr:hypothetical protein [Escherichia coli]